jgi:hypothetical protein
MFRPIRSNSRSTDLWDRLTDFARRRPGLVMAGLLASSLVVDAWRKRQHGRGNQYRFASDAHDRYRPPMPSARLGATEEQINRSRRSMTAASDPPDQVNATGAAFDLDPESVTPG